MDLRQLGQRVKARREKLGLRQADIAAALQISAQAVSKWERGENAPDISVLAELAHLLGVSIEWLLGATSPSRETFRATVFCTSLNGFAAKAASIPPGEVAAWANRIYYAVTEAVRRHDGVPVKYVGDGFLGFFAGINHARRAVEAARLARSSLDPDEVVIVLHVGEIYLGALGHPDYQRPDIIGQTVNTAFLCMPWVVAHCRSGIGVTEAVVAELGAEGFDRAGKVKVAGAEGPITVYEPAEA
ncbi:MAG TPA: helix-turn-helix domain-containing protein [Phycisphaerae bacterium]|nr:helix-turn-helix domain-containing protein [Phycisphaerae bacterium]